MSAAKEQRRRELIAILSRYSIGDRLPLVNWLGLLYDLEKYLDERQGEAGQ